jgi:hypothetical protein
MQYVAPVPQAIPCYDYPNNAQGYIPMRSESPGRVAQHGTTNGMGSVVEGSSASAYLPYNCLDQGNASARVNNGALAWYYPQQSPGTAIQLEKLEIGLRPDKALLSDITVFLSGRRNATNALNPYNRHDVSITCSFYQHGHFVHSVDAFWYREFTTNPAKNGWNEDTTSFPFRIRFAPPQAGDGWEATITIRARGHAVTQRTVTFVVAPSANPGVLEVGSDSRHMRYSRTGQSWFGVGYNAAWANANGWTREGEPATLTNVNAHWDEMQQLAKNHGNFVRIVSTPWHFDFEKEALGNYDPRQAMAWEFDRTNDFLHNNNVFYLYCMKLHGLFVEKAHHAGGSSALNWENNPYYGPFAKASKYPGYSLPQVKRNIDFFADSSAMDHYRNYLRYFYSRWGYNTHMGAVQIMSEENFISGYLDEYNEKGEVKVSNRANRQLIHNWNFQMSKYIKTELRDNHLLSVSSGGVYMPGYGDVIQDNDIYDNPFFDFTGYHCYSDQPENIALGGIFRTDNINRFYHVARQFITGVGADIEHAGTVCRAYLSKPYIIDESGVNLTVPLGPDFPNRKTSGPWPTDIFAACSDGPWHNTLWASAMYGCFSTSLDWYKPAHHAFAAQNLPGIRAFFSDIDFEAYRYGGEQELDGESVFNGLAQRWPATEAEIYATSLPEVGKGQPFTRADRAEALTLVAHNREQAFGWVHNRSVYWYNLRRANECYNNLITGQGYDKPYLAAPRDGDAAGEPLVIEEKGPNSAYILVFNVRKCKRYRIDYFDTRTGALVTTRRHWSSAKGVLKLRLPAMSSTAHPDLGFKIYRKEWQALKPGNHLFKDAGIVQSPGNGVSGELRIMPSEGNTTALMEVRGPESGYLVFSSTSVGDGSFGVWTSSGVKVFSGNVDNHQLAIPLSVLGDSMFRLDVTDEFGNTTRYALAGWH